MVVVVVVVVVVVAAAAAVVVLVVMLPLIMLGVLAAVVCFGRFRVKPFDEAYAPHTPPYLWPYDYGHA